MHDIKTLAVQWLNAALCNGPVAVGQLQASAQRAGIIGADQQIGQTRTFREARKVLGIRPYQEGRRWLWALHVRAQSDEQREPPADGMPTPESSPSEPAHVDTLTETPVDPIWAAAPDPSPEAARRRRDDRPKADRPVVLKWAEEVARLDRRRPPHSSIPRLQWDLFCNDAAKFVTTDFAVRASALGWDDDALFGFDPNVPTRRDRMGLLWFVLGGRITEIYHDGATISSGISQRYHARRRVDQQALRLPWR